MHPATRKIFAILVFLVAAMAALLVVHHFAGYLLFHCLAEIFSVVIAAGVFMVAWNARRFHATPYLTMVGVGFLFVGLTDLLHALSYQGMNVIPCNANLPTQLWILARYLQAGTLVAAPLLMVRHVRAPLLLAGFAFLSAGAYLCIFVWPVFPACYVPGMGQTGFKVGSEYVIAGLLLVAGGLLWRQRRHFDPEVLWLIAASLLVSAAQEIVFTQYISPTSPWNAAGHALKIVSFYLLYEAMIVASLTRPSQVLFKELADARSAAEASRATAEAASRAKDHFLAVLSHELRNPLNPVLMAATTWQRAPGLDPALRADLVMIQRNVALESRLIDDLLDLTRIVRGKMTLARSTVDLHELLQQTIAICGDDIVRKQIQLKTDLGAAFHHAHADPARLQQVFWNLVKNAVKFTPTAGMITITTRNAPGASAASATPALAIVVADTGVGIPAENLPYIFNAFEQGDAAVTRKFGGLGLGLAISKALVEMHAGQIDAQSAGTSQGATFTVTLPTVPAPVQASAPAQVPAVTQPLHAVGALVAPAAPTGLAILLVEDHPDTAKLMARLLRTFAHQVHTVGTLAEARRAAASQRFDLLISDLDLPDGSGHDLMRELKASCQLRGICISGFGMEHDLHESREAGFDAHLTKPVDFQQLQSLLARFAPTSA